MVRGLPFEFTQELLKDAVSLRHLFTITTDDYVYRWTEGNNSIYWLGEWWISKQISIEQAGATLTAQVDSVTLLVSNVDKSFSTLALSEDLRGRDITIQRVLLDRNLYIIGAPATIFVGYLDAIQVDRNRAKIQCFNHMIKWNTPTPRRLHSQNCPWVFKGTECGYNGILIAVPVSDVSVGFTPSTGSSNFPNVDDYLTDLTMGATYSADSDDGAGHVAANAFDDNTATVWTSNASAPHWLQCQFSSGKKIANYTILPNTQTTAPINFKLQGSNDGSTWMDLDVRNGISWKSPPTKMLFDVRTPTSYIYYRLYMDSFTSGTTASIKEVELIGASDELNDADYNYTASTSAQADLFAQPPIALASDVSSIVVTVRVRTKQTVAAARNLAGRLRVSGVDYDASAISPATAFTDYDFIWTTNPKTGAPWNYNEVYSSVDLTLGGTASADTVYGAGQEADKAFDDNTGTNWTSTNTALPHWLQCQLSAAKTAVRYTITGYSTTARSPKDFKLQGSNNGSSWTDLDTQSGITWAANEKKSFLVSSPGSYLYYRLYTTANGSGNLTTIVEMELFDVHFIDGFGYSTPANAGGNRVDVSETWLKISNNISTITCDFTAARCQALNNRLNFGGFYYIPELAAKEYWWGSKQRIFTGPY